MKILVTNRKARHDYTVETPFEAGISLMGSEVKSLRAGLGNLKESWIKLDDNGVWLVGCHISPWAQAREPHPPTRPRQLLLKKGEIAKLRRQVQQKGKTLVPLRIYVSGRYLKVEIALATGKKTYDKRAALKAKDLKREMARKE